MKCGLKEKRKRYQAIVDNYHAEVAERRGSLRKFFRYVEGLYLVLGYCGPHCMLQCFCFADLVYLNKVMHSSISRFLMPYRMGLNKQPLSEVAGVAW